MICPQLAVNIGWLRLIGEAKVEQKSRQTKKALPVSVQQRTWKERRSASRSANKKHRRTLKLHTALAPIMSRKGA